MKVHEDLSVCRPAGLQLDALGHPETPKRVRLRCECVKPFFNTVNVWKRSELVVSNDCSFLGELSLFFKREVIVNYDWLFIKQKNSTFL